MIIATSQDLAAIDCCPCDDYACARPRLDCASSARTAWIDGYLDASEPFANIADILAKKIYSSKTSTATISYTSTTAERDQSNEYTGNYYQEKDKNYYISALTGCPSATNPVESVSCDATGIYTDSVYELDEGVRGHVLWNHTYTLELTTPYVDSYGENCFYRYHRTGANYAEGPPDTWTTTTVDDYGGAWSIVTNGGLELPKPGTPTLTVLYENGVTIENWMRATVDALNDFIDIPAILVSHPTTCASRCGPTATQPIASTILISWEPVNSLEQGLSLRKTQYRFGVPYIAADMPRSVFEAQWDLYSFPHGWLAWQELGEDLAAAIIAHAEWQIVKDFYDANIDAYNTAYAEWEILNAAWVDYYILHEYWEFYPEDFPEGEPLPPEGEPPIEPTPPPDPGPEPIIPDDPGVWADSPLNTCDDAAGPVFVSSESWIWGGDMGAPDADPAIFAANPEQWSPWFTVPIPTLPTPLSDAFDAEGNYLADCINRDVLICNLMTKCYHSAAFGVAPTIHSPIYVPPA